MSNNFDQTIEDLIKELKEIREVLEKGSVIDITKRLKQKRDSDPKVMERKSATRAAAKRSGDPLHQEVDPKTPVMRGQSAAGIMTRQYKKNPAQHAEDKSYGGGAYKEHRDVLGALKRQPKPNLTKEEDHKVKDCETCGTEIKGSHYIGTQKLPESMGFNHDLKMYNCPNKECQTTVSVKTPHEGKTELIKSLNNGQWTIE